MGITIKVKVDQIRFASTVERGLLKSGVRSINKRYKSYEVYFIVRKKIMDPVYSRELPSLYKAIEFALDRQKRGDRKVEIKLIK